MNKKEFLTELKENLIGFPEKEVVEIIEDYEEHFYMGKRRNRRDSDIVKGLGNPREIARELRRDLEKDKNNLSIKTQLIEFWVDAKKLGKKVIRNVDSEIPKVKEGISKLFKFIKNKNKKSRDKKRIWTAVSLTAFNLLVMIWIWFSFFMILIGLFITGISIIITGIVAILSSSFILLSSVDFMLKNMSFSALFAGIGLIFMGILWLIGVSKLMKGLSYITKKYIKFNKRVSKK